MSTVLEQFNAAEAAVKSANEALTHLQEAREHHHARGALPRQESPARPELRHVNSQRRKANRERLRLAADGREEGFESPCGTWERGST
jgi:hypothetical protein